MAGFKKLVPLSQPMKSKTKIWDWHEWRVDAFPKAPLAFLTIPSFFPPMANIFVSVKRKLTERKSSSSSESNSPEGKRTKDENEDEVLRALNMADDVAGKLDKIIAQLRKLDSIETTLNEICNKVAKIEGEVKKLQSDTSLMDGKVKATETKVEEMDKGLTWLNEQVEQLQSKIKNMEDTKEKEFSELSRFETNLC